MPWATRTTLIIAGVGLLLQIYSARRAVWAIARITGWRKSRVALGAVAVTLYFSIQPLSLLFGSVFGFETRFRSSSLFDLAVTYPFWIGLVFGAQLFFALIAIDVVRLAVKLLHKGTRGRSGLVEAWIIVVALAVVALYVCARTYSDTFMLRTRKTELHVADVPKGPGRLRIVHISDIQVDNRTNGRKLDAYVERVNALRPDLILFSGDAVTSGTDYVEDAAEAMGRLRPRFGTYACLGDHDYFSNSNLVADQLRTKGIVVLQDETVNVMADGGVVAITGITNVYRNHASAPIVDKLAADRRAGSLSILLTHQPSEWLVKLAAGRGYDLFLGGHTHGGQIVFPLPGFLLTGSSFETRYVSGFFKVGSMMISINNGLGLTLAPIRYNAPAEVTLIIVPGSAEDEANLSAN